MLSHPAPTPADASPSTAFAPLRNDSFLRACRRQATEHTPIWLMRQAGRYLPEYRVTRARAGSFMGLATNPDYATEVTLQPLDRFPLDASILFSDILTVPDAMGLGLSFAEGEGPRFAHPVRDEAAVAALAVPDMERLRYVFDAQADHTGIPSLLRKLAELGIGFKDLETSKSSLEDIFVDLVGERA